MSALTCWWHVNQITIVLNYRQYRVSVGYDSLDYMAYEAHKFKRRRNMRGKPLTSHYYPILWKLNRYSNNV